MSRHKNAAQVVHQVSDSATRKLQHHQNETQQQQQHQQQGAQITQ